MFIESIRIHQKKAENLEAHEARANQARREILGVTQPLRLREQLVLPDFLDADVWKCRATFGVHLEKLEFERYSPKKISSIQLVLVDDLEYGHKFADRTQLDSLRKNSAADDVLLVKNGFITDFSYANAAFFDGNQWWTPEKPLLGGTRRAQLLAQKRLFTRPIRPSDLAQFTHFRPVNALLQFGRTPFYNCELLITNY